VSIYGGHFLRPDQEPMPGRREALLCVSPEIVLALLLNLNRDRRVTVAGVPTDAKVVSAGYEIQMDCFVLRLESEEFEPIPEGGVSPFLNEITTGGPNQVTCGRPGCRVADGPTPP
jgi:hypothetical protein